MKFPVLGAEEKAYLTSVTHEPSVLGNEYKKFWAVCPNVCEAG